MQRTDTHWLNFTFAALGVLAASSTLVGCDDVESGEVDGSVHDGGGGGKHDAGSGGSHDSGTAGPGDAGLSEAGNPSDAGNPDDAGDPDESRDAGGDASFCCEAEATCQEGEETFKKLDACEAAGEGCHESSICCSTVYCRPSECQGTVVYAKDRCASEDSSYCYPLPSGEYCTGARGSCEASARPIAADKPCPEGYLCSDEPDGMRCATRSFETQAACLEEGDYATPAIGAIVPCDAGDIALGFVQGFEPSLCCLDPEGDKADCEALSAQGVGECEKLIGWTWNGTACVSLSGCSCEGEDCEALFSSPAECEDAQRERQCLPPDCRTEGCPDGDVCEICWAGYACIPKGAVC